MIKSLHNDGFYLDEDHHLIKAKGGTEYAYIARWQAWKSQPTGHAISAPSAPHQHCLQNRRLGKKSWQTFATRSTAIKSCRSGFTSMVKLRPR